MRWVLEKLFSHTEQEWYLAGLQAKHGCCRQSIAGGDGCCRFGGRKVVHMSSRSKFISSIDEEPSNASTTSELYTNTNHNRIHFKPSLPPATSDLGYEALYCSGWRPHPIPSASSLNIAFIHMCIIALFTPPCKKNSQICFCRKEFSLCPVWDVDGYQVV